MGDNGDDNFYYNNYNYNQTHNELDPHVSLASLSLILGLISVPLFLFFNAGIILGGIAVVMALLSRGSEKKLLPQARKGIIYVTIWIIVGYLVNITSFYTIMTDPEERARVNTLTQYYYGQSFDDVLEDMGISIDTQSEQ